MEAKHATDTADGKRLTYHGPSNGRWSSPAAPTFDAVGMPKRNNYRPESSPIHSTDVLIAQQQKDNRRAVRKANKVYTRSQAKVNPQPVTLRRPDGIKVAITFDHPSAITARIVQTKRQIGKTADLAHVSSEAIHAKPGAYYPPLHSAVVPTTLVVETVQPVARTRDVSAFVDILDRLAPAKMRPEGLDYHDAVRETVRERGTDI